ncbi:MAG: STAS domain-containing protein [Actinomycetota bacterium]
MAKMSSELTVQPFDGGICLEGDIDRQTAPDLRTAVAVHLGSHDSLRIDMSGVTFIDSSGLRIMLAAQSDAEAAGGSFALVDPSAPVLRLLDLSSLDDQFPIVTTGGLPDTVKANAEIKPADAHAAADARQLAADLAETTDD